MIIYQLILPLITAILNIFICNNIAIIIGITTTIANIILYLYSPIQILYNFGGWHESIGISHTYTIYKSHIIVIIHILFLLYYILYRQFLLQQKPLFFTILSLLYFGIIGMLLTNDLFNLYVFLEVISLCSIIIIASSANYKAALEYLIYGSLFATISLASIAIIMCNQKTLVLSDIKQNFSTISEIAINIFIFGLLGKTSLYIFQLYKSNELTYKTLNIKLMPILTLSSCILLYKISQVIHLSTNSEWIILLAIINSIYASYLAQFENNIRYIFFYSIMSSNGYILLAMLYVPMLSTNIIINEFIVKFFLFYALSYYKFNNITNMYTIKKYPTLYWALLLTIFSSAGFPITNGFFIKISILQSIMNTKHYITFVATLISMGFSINYHWKILYHIYLLKCENYHNISITKKFIHYIYIIFIIFGSLIYLNIID